MSKPIAIPLLLAAAITLFFAIPAFRHPDPHNPDFAWYLAAPAATSAALGLCILANLFTFPRKAMQALPIAHEGVAIEFRLLPQQFRKERIRNATVLLLTLSLPAGVLAVRLESERPASSYAHLITITAAILFIALLVNVLRRSHSTRHHSDVRLLLTAAPVQLDDPFTLRFELDTCRSLHIAQARARIRCFEHNLFHTGRYVQISVKQRDQITLPLLAETTTSGSETITGSAQVVLDSTLYPHSGKWGVPMYPFYHWEIHIEILGEAPSTTLFPLTVERRPAPVPSLF